MGLWKYLGDACKGAFDGVDKIWQSIFHHFDEAGKDTKNAVIQGKDAIADGIKGEWDGYIKPIILKDWELLKQEIIKTNLANLKTFEDETLANLKAGQITNIENYYAKFVKPAIKQDLEDSKAEIIKEFTTAIMQVKDELINQIKGVK